MYQKKLLAKPVVIIMIIFVLYSFLAPKGVNAANNEINITTDPQKSLFQVVEAAPGDVLSKEITIWNSGTKNFQYTFVTGIHKSYIDLYENLTLKIEQSSNLLYSGLLKSFTGIPPRYLET
ncbi:hypothetical protein [Peribacillus deserti]|uniref:Uncharacterized protein n=1 Tax=Peribacillus deserti TaxID=673318 RepID=A0A2N5M9Q2_9BACI|nr:hypothetical protein [Peribacillus deserti]PLT31081.1 hypothetical protein CUU66_04585 [Peribacillus deserti]